MNDHQKTWLWLFLFADAWWLFIFFQLKTGVSYLGRNRGYSLLTTRRRDEEPTAFWWGIYLQILPAVFLTAISLDALFGLDIFGK